MPIEKTPLYELQYGRITLDCGFDGQQAKIVDAWSIAGVSPEEWYEDGLQPYGLLNGQLIKDGDIGRAQLWAELFIAQRTDYIVSGWNGRTPILYILEYLMEFVMVGGKVSAVVGRREHERVMDRFNCPGTYMHEMGNGTTIECVHAREAVTIQTLEAGDTSLTINLNQVSCITGTQKKRIVELFA